MESAKHLSVEQQQRFALEGAMEALEITIKRTEKRLEETRNRAEIYHQTIFVVFDAADKPEPTILVGDEAQQVFHEMDSVSGRNYLVTRQLRHEYEAELLSHKLQILNDELMSIKSQLR